MCSKQLDVGDQVVGRVRQDCHRSLSKRGHPRRRVACRARMARFQGKGLACTSPCLGNFRGNRSGDRCAQASLSSDGLERVMGIEPELARQVVVEIRCREQFAAVNGEKCAKGYR